jgi:hypothetical protein
MRSQFITRLRRISDSPTVGMLFSTAHATMHALQPVHLSTSIVMPQR